MYEHQKAGEGAARSMEKDIFQSIYEKYYRPLYLYALSLCHNPADADDLVQSTFLKAFLSYEEGGSIRYWLTKVLQNEYYNLCRQRKKLISEDAAQLEQIADLAPGVLEQLIHEEQKRYLFQCIWELGDAQKMAVLGSVYFGLSDEELGRQLKTTRENVRQLRSRARKQIVKKMEERYG